MRRTRQKFRKNFKNHKPPLNQPGQTHIDTKKLATIFLILGLIITSLITYPLAQVFSGHEGWIVNQSLPLLTIPSFELPFLGSIAIGEVAIRFYAIFMLAGILAGYFIALYLAKQQGLSTSTIDKLFLGLLLTGLLGARIFYVLFNLEAYQDNWLEVLNISSGGLSFFGAILGAGLYLFFYTHRHKFNLFEILDILAPSVLLGQVIGRWGNFFNYEAYGGSTGLFWKMYVPEAARIANNYSLESINAQYFHPTFLYEIIPNFILFILILRAYGELTDKRAGLVFAFYAICYGIIRFFIEFFRLDALTIYLPTYLQFNLFGAITIDRLLVGQIASVILMLVGAFVWIKRQNVLYLNRSMREIKT